MLGLIYSYDLSGHAQIKQKPHILGLIDSYDLSGHTLYMYMFNFGLHLLE